EQITRWLGSPSNMTLETLSDLLFALTGKEPDTRALLVGELDQIRDSEFYRTTGLRQLAVTVPPDDYVMALAVNWFVRIPGSYPLSGPTLLSNRVEEIEAWNPEPLIPLPSRGEEPISIETSIPTLSRRTSMPLT